MYQPTSGSWARLSYDPYADLTPCLLANSFALSRLLAATATSCTWRHSFSSTVHISTSHSQRFQEAQMSQRDGTTLHVSSNPLWNRHPNVQQKWSVLQSCMTTCILVHQLPACLTCSESPPKTAQNSSHLRRQVNNNTATLFNCANAVAPFVGHTTAHSTKIYWLFNVGPHSSTQKTNYI